MKKILILFLIISLKLNSQTPVNIYNPYNFLKYITVADTITSRYLFLKPQNYYPYNPSKDMIINYKDTFKIYTGSIWMLFGGSGGGTVDTTKTPYAGHLATQYDLTKKLNVIDTVKRAKLMTRKATDSLYQVKGNYLTSVDTTKTPYLGHYGTQYDLIKKLNISNYQSDTTAANRKIETYTQFLKDTVQLTIPGIVSIHDFSVWNAKINFSNLSGTSPITYSNTTGAIGINTANTSTTGVLTSTDWNTFNGKYSGLPSQIGNSGKVLTTNGTNESWGTVSSMVYPSDTGIVHMSSANTYGQSYNASHKIPLVDIPSLPESQVTNLITDLGSKLNVIDTVKRAKLMTRKATDSLYQVKGSYLTANQTITLGGILSGSGSTSISASAASGYYMPSTGDQTNWNAKLSNYTETDPVFSTSVAKKVTAADTVKWNAKLSSYTETDPIYSISTASKINAADTVKWNAKLSSYTETDPIFIADSSLFLSKTKYKADTTDKKIKTGYQAILDTTKLHNEIFSRLSSVNAGSTLLGLGTASSALKVDTTLIETKADILKRFTASNFGTYISGNGTTIVSSLYNGYQKFTGSGTITGWSIQEGSSSPVSSTTAVSLYTGSTPAYSSLSSILTMNLSSASNASATGLSIAFTAGQYYIFNVTSNSAAQYLTIQIYYTR